MMDVTIIPDTQVSSLIALPKITEPSEWVWGAQSICRAIEMSENAMIRAGMAVSPSPVEYGRCCCSEYHVIEMGQWSDVSYSANAAGLAEQMSGMRGKMELLWCHRTYELSLLLRCDVISLASDCILSS
jgi:hypothetical protein